MAGNLGKRWGAWVKVVSLAAAAVALAGCSTGPGGGMRFTLFPDTGTLMETTKAVRQPCSPPPPVPRELAQRLLPPYTVEPGDTLLVQPADVDSPVQLPGDQPILPDGTISLGRYGQVIVAGKTVREIEGLVRAVIKGQDKDPGPIVVRIVARVSKVYYVLGEVNAPGAFPIQGRETVLDGIVAAGGLTDRASRVNIVLARPTAPDHCRVVLPVCYREIVQLGDTTTNYQLAPGDRIYVAGRGFHEGMFGPNHKKVQSPCGCCSPQVPCPLGHDDHHPPIPAGVAPPVDALPSLNGAILPPASPRDTLGLPLSEKP